MKLKTPVNGVDYINASYITGDLSNDPNNPQKNDEMDIMNHDEENPSRWSNINFIASQGPLPDTTLEQIEMMWENKVDIAVMLTRCKEKDKSKLKFHIILGILIMINTIRGIRI